VLPLAWSFSEMIWNLSPIGVFLRLPTKTDRSPFLRSSSSQVGSPPAHRQQNQLQDLGTYCRGGPPWPPGVIAEIESHATRPVGMLWCLEIEFHAGRPRRAAPTVRPEIFILSETACDSSSLSRAGSRLQDLRLRVRAADTSRVLSKRRSGRPACDTQVTG